MIDNLIIFIHTYVKTSSKCEKKKKKNLTNLTKEMHMITDFTHVYHILHGDCVTRMVSTFNIVENAISRRHAYKLIKQHCSIDATKYFSPTVLSASGTICLTLWSILPLCPLLGVVFLLSIFLIITINESMRSAVELITC